MRVLTAIYIWSKNASSLDKKGRLQEKENSIGAMGGVRKLLGALMNEGVQKVGLIMEQRELGARIRGACKKEF